MLQAVSFTQTADGIHLKSYPDQTMIAKANKYLHMHCWTHQTMHKINPNGMGLSGKRGGRVDVVEEQPIHPVNNYVESLANSGCG